MPPRADEALQRLVDGNARFVAGTPAAEPITSAVLRELARGQEPFAIVLGCADSRVATEIIFDQGLGDLFVIRVAGNVVTPTVIGSVEFAAATLGTELCVVLGHSNCGAVMATLAKLREEPGLDSPGLTSITARITPAVAPAVAATRGDDAEVLDAAVRANVVASVQQLTDDSAILRDLIEQGRFRVVGALKDLATGVVRFLD